MIRYYYLRDKNNKPVITVCLFEVNDIGKGLAVCSDSDNPKKSIGRRKAMGRAIKALANEKDSSFISRPSVRKQVMNLTMPGGKYPYAKSLFNPELTAYEKQILGIKDERPNWAGIIRYK